MWPSRQDGGIMYFAEIAPDRRFTLPSINGGVGGDGDGKSRPVAMAERGSSI